MLFTSLFQLEQDPLRGFVTLATFALALVVAITFHEFSHALFATRLGDPTAKALGRLSLHPKAHLDPVGIVMIFLAGFGWGKPVPVNAAYLHTGERPGMAMVSIAGPLANVVVAAIFAVLMKAGVVTFSVRGLLVVLRLDGGPGRLRSGVHRLLEPPSRLLQPHPPGAAGRLQSGVGRPAQGHRRELRKTRAARPYDTD